MDCNRKKKIFNVVDYNYIFLFFNPIGQRSIYIPINQVFWRSKVTIKTMLGITKNGAETVTLLQQHVVDFSESSFFW